MTTNYPGAQDSFTRPTAGQSRKTLSEAGLFDHLMDATEAIEGELGTNPSGSEATVAARLGTLDTTVSARATTAALTAHIDDTSSAHAASAISATAIGAPGNSTVDATLSDLQTPVSTSFLRLLATGSVNVLGIGDSILEGYNSTADANLSGRWLARVVGALRNAAQPAGIAGGRGYVPAYYEGSGFDSYSWTQSGTTTESTTQGLGRRAVSLSSTGTLTLANVWGTSVDIVYRRATGAGSFTVAVDGVTLATQSAAAAPYESGGYKLRVTFPARGSHSIVVAHSSGSAVVVEGAMIYDGDESSGIRLWDGAHSGYSASSFASNLTWFQSLQAAVPDLILIGLGTNDLAIPRTAAEFGANMTTIVSNIRSAAVPGGSTVAATCPIVFVHYGYRLDGVGTAQLWADYLAQLATVAAADVNATVLDLSTILTSAEWDSLIDTDNIHPVDAGHGVIAGIVSAALLRVARPAAKIPNASTVATWSAPRHFRSGQWYGPEGNSTDTTVAISVNLEFAVRFEVGQATTFDRIGIEVTTGAGSGTARLGIRQDNGNCYPSTLILDAGTVDATSTGAKSITINQPLAPGRYWLTCTAQGAGITVRQRSFDTMIGAPSGATVNLASFWQNPVSSALPSTFSASTAADASGPKVMLRAA